MELKDILSLEPHGPDTFVGEGPKYPWGGLFGGQIVAQGLLAAGSTVDPHYRIHSLHAYFIRMGDASEPIRFEVDRIRNGRTFTTRRVVARQATGAILTMAASFQVDEDAPEVQIAQMPADIPAAADLPSETWSSVFDRRQIRTGEPGRSVGWLKVTQDIGDDPLIQACAVAFLSDDLPTDAAVALHPDRAAMHVETSLGDPLSEMQEYPFFSASLDHAMFFHHPLRADEWHLHDFNCHGLMSSRGLAIGQLYAADGRHAVTVTQEVLLRGRRD